MNAVIFVSWAITNLVSNIPCSPALITPSRVFAVGDEVVGGQFAKLEVSSDRAEEMVEFVLNWF